MAQAIAVQPGIYICLCSGARGEFFCIECEQYFCKTCRISHKKASVSKSHQLVEVIETESKECEMCLTKYAGQFFCLDCGQYFCRNCKTSHLRANVSKNHVFRDSADLETRWVIPPISHLKCNMPFKYVIVLGFFLQVNQSQINGNRPLKEYVTIPWQNYLFTFPSLYKTGEGVAAY